MLPVVEGGRELLTTRAAGDMARAAALDPTGKVWTGGLGELRSGRARVRVGMGPTLRSPPLS